mmetsp:Transcript_141440/g.244406  ORF Transcript_141440/g.244406 Transcript_141440/m.244406 type:complete len:948 (+) Transcript_141440:74-2917(+)
MQLLVLFVACVAFARQQVVQCQDELMAEKDYYAAPASGAATADEWCSEESNEGDPICDANTIIVSLRQQIAGNFQRTICRFHPDDSICQLDESNTAEIMNGVQDVDVSVSLLEKQTPVRSTLVSDVQKTETLKFSSTLTSDSAEKRSRDWWTTERFLNELGSRFSSSDAAFERVDSDHDRWVSEAEFKHFCKFLGCPVDFAKKTYRELSGGHKQQISEEDFKDEIGATFPEIERRIANKYGSPDAAFEAADEDEDGLISTWEWYQQCALVALSLACQKTRDRLPSTMTRLEYFTTFGMKVETAVARAPPAAIVPAEDTSLQNVGFEIEDLKELRSRLQKEGRYDPELRKSVEKIIERSRIVLESMEEVQKLTGEEADHELDALVVEVSNMEDSFFVFQTEVHPHGYKWWRFRWEYAFVEANILNLLIFITMGLYHLIDWFLPHMHKYSAHDDCKGIAGATSILDVFYTNFERLLHELNVQGAILFIIWALEQFGWFSFIIKFLPVTFVIDGLAEASVSSGQQRKAQDLHLPTSDTQYITAVRIVSVHLFIAMTFYYLLIHHLLHTTACVLQGFLKIERPDIFEQLTSNNVKETEIYKDLHKELKRKAKTTKIILQEHHGWLGLSRSLGWFTERLINGTWTGRFIGRFDKAEDFEKLKRYLSVHLSHVDGFNAKRQTGEPLYKILLEAPVYPYLALMLQENITRMMCIDWKGWVFVQIVLVIQALLHFYLNISVIQLLPFTVSFGIALLALQHAWTCKQAAYVTDPKVLIREEGGEEGEGEEDQPIVRSRSTTEVIRERIVEKVAESFSAKLLSLAGNWGDDVVLRLQQTNLFFLCFSCARLLFSWFFWTDHFWTSLIVLVLYLCLYAAFILIASISLTFYFILFAVPPHMFEREEHLMHDWLVHFAQRRDGSAPQGFTGTPRLSEEARQISPGSVLDFPYASQYMLP